MSQRRRREPEQAREEMLTAAGELIARLGPDGVGLRQVAEAVGVTHGLVSHYFGTYGALAQAVLRRESEHHHERVREQLRADHDLPYADSMIRVLLETLTDERYVRLWAWSTLHATDSDTAPAGNLRELVTVIQAGIGAVVPAAQMPDRDRIESAVLLGLSAAYGYTLGKRVWLTELGHDPADPVKDAAFRELLSAAVTVHLVEK
ncbi:MAG: TetR/AcrR family transcriptional regulator [Actinomycetota bacterium]|nr:TetR/AcrR family transcriptional regulator [Actinomycetota bacterium]